MDFDVTIIGGGVVGLACAEKMSSLKMRTLLIERHPFFGNEASSRNSEVIHAGIYYQKDSLKAKLCVPGNTSIYDWCKKKNVNYWNTGKYIVAVNDDELEGLDNIYRRAKDNGVEGIRYTTLDNLKYSEPNVIAVGALWSGDTGIVDSHGLMQSLEQSAIENGCDIVYNHTLKGIEKISGGYKLFISSGDDSFSIETERVINSAGLDSDLVAEMAGIDIDEADYRLHYARGHYFRIKSSKKHLANHLIYPVPAKNFAGLGIHITLDMAGELRLGPDVLYLKERVQDYGLPVELRDDFYKSVSRYLRGLDVWDIYPDYSGIRAKLQPEGGAIRDFVIKEESERGLPGLVNLIGIESPGLTCSLEIAGMVGKM